MFWIQCNKPRVQPDYSGDTERVALLSSQKHGWMISPWIRMWYWMVLNSYPRLLMLPLLASFYSLLYHSGRHPTPKRSFSFLGILTTPPCLPLSPHSPNMSTVTPETIEIWICFTLSSKMPINQYPYPHWAVLIIIWSTWPVTYP